METGYPLYWTDPLVREFRVSILECQSVGKSFEIRIREQVVRPEGGGQAGDRGELKIGKKGISFADTVMREKGVTLVTQLPIAERTEATLVIDMQWRRAMMRNHSAEHLFVGALKRLKPQLQPGYIWIDGRHGTVELTGASVTVEDILAAESEVQHVVSLDVPVTTEVVSSSKLDPATRVREGVTSKHDELRIVKIGDSDSSACSGIHVLNSGDVGLFKVIDYKITDSSVRLEFVAGEAASELVSKVFNAVLTRKYEYPYQLDQVGAVLDKSKTAWNERNELLDAVERLVIERPLTKIVGRVSFVNEYLPGFDTNRMKRLVKKMHLVGPSVVFLMSPGEKSNFIIVTNEIAASADDIAGTIIKQLGGKGGGSNDVYTGGFVGVHSPPELHQQLTAELESGLVNL
jgi:alanyl-tRNA synthetase